MIKWDFYQEHCLDLEIVKEIGHMILVPVHCTAPNIRINKKPSACRDPSMHRDAWNPYLEKMHCSADIVVAGDSELFLPGHSARPPAASCGGGMARRVCQCFTVHNSGWAPVKTRINLESGPGPGPMPAHGGCLQGRAGPGPPGATWQPWPSLAALSWWLWLESPS